MTKFIETSRMLFLNGIIAICVIGSVACVMWAINQPKDKVENDGFTTYVEDTIDQSEQLTNLVYASISSGEWDEYYSEDELEGLKELGLR